MALTINGSPLPPKPTPKKKKCTHTKPQQPSFTLDDPGQKVRKSNFQWFLGGMSQSAFKARLDRHLIPEPDGKDKNRPFWWSETVKAFLQGLERRLWQWYDKDTARY